MNKDENKVFVVTTGEYSDYTIDRVFSTRKKALEYLDTKDDRYTLEVYDLDEAYELQSISRMPARVKCAELAWRTLDGML